MDTTSKTRLNLFEKTSIKPTAIRAEPGADADTVILTVVTRYAGDMTYALPRAMADALMADLERSRSTQPAAAVEVADAHAPAGISPGFAAADQTSTPASLPVIPPAVNGGSGPPAAAAQKPANGNPITVRTPKRWVLGNGLPSHPLVVFVVDPQTDQQAGYAFDIKAAREMAAALVKHADEITAYDDRKRSRLS